MADLSTTVGVWLISVFFQALLQGIGLLQSFLYFVWYPRDSWTVKATVIALVLFQCLQMAAAFANIYAWFITGFGSFDALDTIHTQDIVELMALFISIFIAQAHFARCIYQLKRSHIILPAVILIFALTALGDGIAQVTISARVGRYSKIDKPTRVTTNLHAAFALATDMLITFGLCWRLNKNRSGIQSTNKVVNFLIMTAINRGVFTMCFAALNIILFLSKPGTFYFMMGFFISDKLYMNSLLAILNTRNYAVHVRGAGPSHAEHISMPIFAPSPPSSRHNARLGTGLDSPQGRDAGAGAISVLTVTEIHQDLDHKDNEERKVAIAV